MLSPFREAKPITIISQSCIGEDDFGRFRLPAAGKRVKFDGTRITRITRILGMKFSGFQVSLVAKPNSQLSNTLAFFSSVLINLFSLRPLFSCLFV